MKYNIIKNFDDKLILDNDKYVVALSGGKDSMCLMHNMLLLKSVKNIDVYAIHINHGIRGEEALRDENFVKNFCKNNNVFLKVAYVECIKYAKDNHKTIEEAARILRYREFDKYIKELNAKLLVAHHKKDQVETIIHNIARGAGIRGLVGIEKKKDYIIRPMLKVSKGDIDKYIVDNKIQYVDDSTNDDENYTRNYIRKIVIKNLEHINDKAIDHICDLSNDAKEVDDYFLELSKYVLMQIILSSDENVVEIDCKKFDEQRHITKIYIIREILERLAIPKKDITRTHMDDVIQMASKIKGGHIDLPYNVTVDKKSNILKFLVNENNVSISKKHKKLI